MSKGIKKRGVCFLAMAIVILWPQITFAQIKGFKLHRSTLIEKELECVSKSLGEDSKVSWQDICYSWDAPQKKSREDVISDALDAVEMRTYNARSQRTPPPQKDYFPRKSKKQTKNEREEASDPSVEDWLRDEYPYFYKEYKERQGETFEESEEAFERESKLYPFIKNIDYGIVIESDEEPRYYFETVFPIYQSDEKMHTFFSHDRISVNGDTDATYSGGIGYRYYDDFYDYIFGLNSFFDYQKQGSHYRNSFGAEFIGQDVESRLNYYNGLSPRRELDSGFEQAVDGVDFELGASIPSYPLAKIFGGYQWYNHEHSSDVQGWKSRLEVRPAPSLVLNLEVIDEDNADLRWRFDGRFDFNFRTFDPKDILADMKGEESDPVRIDLTERLLDRVERSFNVRTEKWKLSTAGTLIFDVFVEVRFPGTNCSAQCESDGNMNGIVDVGEGFELDVVLENLSSGSLTGNSVANVVLSNTVDFNLPPGAPNTLPDANPGQIVRTNNSQDIDFDIPAGATNGNSTFISFDVITSAGTRSFTFGPIEIGNTINGQQYH